MRALAIKDRFGAEHLVWLDLPDPVPGTGEVLVRISALSLNFRDLQIIEGGRPIALPLIVLSDACGKVVGLGPGVSRLAIGDRVMPCFVQGWADGPIPPGDSLPTLGGPLEGACRPLAAWPETGLVRVPSHLADAEAATLPCAAVSAWNALFEAAHLRPGETVLVQGTGGVALFALQFAKLAGAKVILISGSDEKIARARMLGADEAINYLSVPEWGGVARGMAVDGVDLIVEVGGEATMGQSIAALRNGGRISYVGFLSGTRPRFDLGEISRKALTVAGIRVGSRASFERMCAAISAAGLRPVLDESFAITDLPDALRRMKAGAHFGKIELVPDWPA